MDLDDPRPEEVPAEAVGMFPSFFDVDQMV